MFDITNAMERYEEENFALRVCLREFQSQASTLKWEAKTLEDESTQLTKSTAEFTVNVQGFSRQNDTISQTLKEIGQKVEDLKDDQKEIEPKIRSLRKQLHKLRDLNYKIAKTYNELVEEHEKCRTHNRTMAQEIKGFDQLRETWASKRQLLTKSLKRRQRGVARLMDGYQRGVLRNIAHDAAQLDTDEADTHPPGVMTRLRFAEFLRRIPATLEVDFGRLVMLFDRLSKDDVLEDKFVDLIIAEVAATSGQEKLLEVTTGPEESEANISRQSSAQTFL